MPAFSGLRAKQQAAVDTWFPGATLVADHSWGVVERSVLQLRHGGRDVVVKAGGPDDEHMDREIWAHREVVTPLVERSLPSRMLRADPRLRLLATTFLPGRLVEGAPAGYQPDLYRQAGRALALLHAQGSRPGDDYEARSDAKGAGLVGSQAPHRR